MHLKNPKGIFLPKLEKKKKNNSKIHMDPQRALNSQNNLEQKGQN